MANKDIQTGILWTIIILTLSSSWPGSVRAQAQESIDGKLKVVGDAALQKGDPFKCPIGQDCHERSQVDTDSDITDATKNASFPPRGLWDAMKESNSGISNEMTDVAMLDAPVVAPEPETGTQLSRSKGRSKADKKLKRKNRRKKCKQRRRKWKLERKIRKRGGKGKNGGKRMAKGRQGKKGKGKKFKRMRKCGKRRRRRRRKDRKSRKNGRKRLNEKLNNGKGIDNSNATTTSTLDSDSVAVNVRGSGVKDIGTTKSKQVDADSSVVGRNSEGTRGQTDATESSENNVVDSKTGVGEEGGALSTSEPEFDAIQITALFQEALDSDSSGRKFVIFEKYVKAYKRLASVFHFFGPIFAFAKSDLEDKINILGQLRRSSIQGPNPDNYDTFKSMFEYEYSEGIARPGGDVTSGVRENAWIHRALKFIIAIVRTVADKKDTSPLHSRVKQFYSEILAPHHSWVVRMGVYAAIYSFPSRETLLEDMKITDDAEGMRELTRLADSLQAVYDLIQAQYEKYAPSK